MQFGESSKLQFGEYSPQGIDGFKAVFYPGSLKA
jgi:hypothetical protein